MYVGDTAVDGAALSNEPGQVGMYMSVQQRFKSVCTLAQSDQSLISVFSPEMTFTDWPMMAHF